MYQFSQAPSTSTTNDYISYGHHGLALNRTMERRNAEHRQDQISATLRLSGRMSNFRQWLGDAMIRLGSRMANEPVQAPRATPNVHPSADMV